MSVVLNFGRDASGYNAFSPSPSNNKYSATLVNGAASSVTVPSTSSLWDVVFSYQPGDSVWVDFSGATAAIPVGATFAATTSELLPASRRVLAGTVVSAITDNATADVGIMLYAVSQ